MQYTKELLASIGAERARGPFTLGQLRGNAWFPDTASYDLSPLVIATTPHLYLELDNQPCAVLAHLHRTPGVIAELACVALPDGLFVTVLEESDPYYAGAQTIAIVNSHSAELFEGTVIDVEVLREEKEQAAEFYKVLNGGGVI